MTENSTTQTDRNVSPIYRLGDTVVFKYEGNMRARVTGHRVMYGRVWVEAQAASQVVCVEPREEG